MKLTEKCKSDEVIPTEYGTLTCGEWMACEIERLRRSGVTAWIEVENGGIVLCRDDNVELIKED